MFRRIGGRGRRGSDVLDRALARALAERADAARDSGRFGDAAVLYDEAIALGDARPGIRVQAGHMHKEAGDHVAAERHYEAAAEAMPEDADLALQLGHFHKLRGHLRDAEKAYARALKLKPSWVAPQQELAGLVRAGWRGDERGAAATPVGLDPSLDAAAIQRAATFDRLVPELMPLPEKQLLVRHEEAIHLRRLGRIERTFWGNHVTLRGVEAIRGFCIAADPIVELQILVNGLLFHAGPVRGYAIANERDDPALNKYVFNVWLDFASFQPGRYALELRFLDADGTPDPQGGRRVYRDHVVIAEPLPEPRFAGGDAWTPPTDPADPRSAEAQIDARPSVVSDARSAVFDTPPKNVLILRTDQLGDVVVSIPAIRRLRALLPDARIVGLFTAANADLVRTLGLLDEVIVIDFPDEKVIQRKRVMTPENQEALRERLHAYRFDLALDLAPAVESRPLLLLSGAAFLAGMRDKNWPYINCGFDLNTYDPVGRSDIMPASSKTLAFVESLGIMMNGAAEVVRRTDLPRERLATFGIGADDRFAIVHTGARVIFSRWAHYPEIAERVLAQTDCKVVMLTENPETRAELPPRLLDDPRFILLDYRLDFDDFDALLSYCTCFVGNDSGPKHLAALRGSNVVSLHTARINWGEWGQEQTGKVIHRQVPCAGCHVYHNPEECGKDYVCVAAIRVDEVWGAMKPYLTGSAA